MRTNLSIPTLLCVVSIWLLVLSLPAIAEQNATNATNGTNATPTVTPTVTPNITITPIATPTISPTPTATTIKEAKFRVGPVVKLRPLNDEVNKSADGLVELFMSNPSLNDVTLHVDAYVSAPSGIYVYGQGFGQAGAAGTVYGTFDVPPGTARTVYMNIKGEKVGEFFIDFKGLYYPDDNKDAYNPISLQHPFKVREPSPEPKSSEPTNPEQIPEMPTSIPWTSIIIAVSIFLVLVGIGVMFALGRKPPKPEVNIEQR